MIVFTDLDGTLLDHHSYRYDPARPALNALAARDIPVVLASSKTAAEIQPLQHALGLAQWPAIVENGAGVMSPEADLPDRSAYHTLRAALDGIQPDLRAQFSGFGDVKDAQVAAWTGLPIDQATLARARAFTEPGIFSGSDDERAAFTEALVEQGVQAKQGGRFLTLTFGTTKADAMREVAKSLGTPPVVALGDAPNDADMLRAADIAIIIRNDHGPSPGDIPGAIRTRLEGPSGWNAAVLELLQD